MEVQVFGQKKHPDVRKALRFFAERRVKTHLVDFASRSPSAGELRRFVQRFGIEGVLDRDSQRFAELGLRHASYSPERWADVLAEEPLLLRLPLVRWKDRLTVGADEAAWKEWVASAG